MMKTSTNSLTAEALSSLDRSGMIEIPMTPADVSKTFSTRSFKAHQHQHIPNFAPPPGIAIPKRVSSHSDLQAAASVLKNANNNNNTSSSSPSSDAPSSPMPTPRLKKPVTSRPVSTESSSDGSDDAGSGSRVSSITSISSTDMQSLQANINKNSTPNSIMSSYQSRIAQNQFKGNNLSLSNLNNNNNSSNCLHRPTKLTHRNSSNGTMSSTSSNISGEFKRLPLRRYSMRSMTKAERAKRYDELEDDDDIPDDSTMFNVPMTLHSTASLFSHNNLNQSTEVLRKAWVEDAGHIIPPSPLPGAIAFPGSPSSQGSSSAHPGDEPNQAQLKRMSSASGSTNSSTPSSPYKATTNFANDGSPSCTIAKHNSFNALSPMAQQLSSFYEFSIQNNVEEELRRRSTMSTHEIYLDGSMEDLKLISSEKLDELSITRPSWLPPKDKQESHKQEHQFKKMIEDQGKMLKKQNALKEEREKSRQLGDARLLYLSGKSQLSNSNLNEIKKLIWRSQVDPQVRFTLFTKILKQREQLVSEDDEKKLKCPVVRNTNLKIDVQSLVSSNTDLYDNPKLVTALSNLLKSTTAMTHWKFNSFAIASSLLLNEFNATLALNTLYYINQFVITESFITKFNSNVTKNHVMKSHMKSFKDDLMVINFDSFVKLLSNIQKPNLCFKLCSLLIVHCDYKLLYAFLLTIIVHYHFGWNNLQLLINGSANGGSTAAGFRVDDEELFWSRVYGLYKKF
ncbi:unnamed protein product [Ambrosiozyma monospora]|uniref:Unnamed protein product n=1 Tax=Ambrosiozyma monospora TaxID=43982 RepID=A0A9W6YSG3_AMBMO|nr:unnamed protein product [Ambrosiozyma monospora]